MKHSLSSTDWIRLINRSKFEMLLLGTTMYQMAMVFYTVIFKVPFFNNIFESMNVELPLFTKLLLETSHFANEWMIITVPFVAGTFIVPGTIYILGLAMKETYSEDSRLGALSFIGLLTLFLLSLATYQIIWFSIEAPFTKILCCVS